MRWWPFKKKRAKRYFDPSAIPLTLIYVVRENPPGLLFRLKDWINR